MIELRSISKEVTEAGGQVVPILKGIDLSVAAGEFVSIMGPSGSGKSTLLNLIGLLDEPTSGEIWFEGTNVRKLSGRALAEFRNGRIGFVFQAFMLIPRLTVKENVEVPLLYANCSARERKRRMEHALEQVGLLHKAKEPIVNLSGGQKQKVAIARSIVNQPDVLLADEPSGNLDADSKEEILQIFESLNMQGKTVVLVTHDREAALFGNRILTLRNGRWSESDTAFIPSAATFTGTGVPG